MARILRRASVDEPTSLDKPPKSGQDRVPRPLKTAAVVVWLLIFAATGLAVAYDKLTADHLFPSTRIGGIVVGSRSLDNAQDILTERVVRPLQTEPITLDAAGERLQASAWRIGLRLDVAKAVRAVHERQQSSSFAARVWRRVFGDAERYPLRSTIAHDLLTGFMTQTAQRIDRPARDASVELAGGELKITPHETGRRLDVPRAVDQLVGALRQGQRNLQLPVEIFEPSLRTESFSKVIFVRTGSNRLELYLDRKHAKTYPVATGTPGYPTPHGKFRVTVKRRNPTWVNPWADWSLNMPARIGPGPNNPLGTRALNISASGIRIHGTPDASSIGGPASHGCIRMFMHDAEELFDRVDVGTPVIITGT